MRADCLVLTGVAEQAEKRTGVKYVDSGMNAPLDVHGAAMVM